MHLDELEGRTSSSSPAPTSNSYGPMATWGSIFSSSPVDPTTQIDRYTEPDPDRSIDRRHESIQAAVISHASVAFMQELSNDCLAAPCLSLDLQVVVMVSSVNRSPSRPALSMRSASSTCRCLPCSIDLSIYGALYRTPCTSSIGTQCCLALWMDRRARQV
jgi:hypothetical protein